MPLFCGLLKSNCRWNHKEYGCHFHLFRVFSPELCTWSWCYYNYWYENTPSGEQGSFPRHFIPYMILTLLLPILCIPVVVPTDPSRNFWYMCCSSSFPKITIICLSFAKGKDPSLLHLHHWEVWEVEVTLNAFVLWSIKIKLQVKPQRIWLSFSPV